MFPVDIAKFSGTDFFYRTPSLAASESPTTINQLGCLFFDFTLPRAFDFDQKLAQNVAPINLYCHVTTQSLHCLN